LEFKRPAKNCEKTKQVSAVDDCQRIVLRREVFVCLFVCLENAAVLETGGGRSGVTRFESIEASMLRIVRSMSFLTILKMTASGC
jgi:hypothetical protein